MAVTAAHVHSFAATLRERLETLETLQEHKWDALGNEQAKDYPNEDRLERLQEQVDILEDATRALDEICEALENYT